MFTQWFSQIAEMEESYEDRVVSHFEEGDLIVDTAEVTDGKQPYETGICSLYYNEGKWVIVEAYDTKEEAEIGHNCWVEKMTKDALPTTLVDCVNCQVADAFMGYEKPVYPFTLSLPAQGSV